MTVSVCNNTYMVQKTNASRDRDLLRISGAWLAIEINRDLDMGFVGLSFDLCCSCCHNETEVREKADDCSVPSRRTTERSCGEKDLICESHRA